METPPQFFYGTAWKEEKTADFTNQALSAGFRAIDTANQRKHYNESGVGDGVKRFLSSSSLSRKDLFIQTKFTYLRGQDHRLPYNPKDSFFKQVQDSFESSLNHLQVDHLDSFVLHGPYHPEMITPEDIETWTSMERLFKEKKVNNLGVSNISPKQLNDLIQAVEIKPKIVQNRCFARLGWDREVRKICSKFQIQYQGFSVLTANQMELTHPFMISLAKKYSRSIPEIVFRFCNQLGMLNLTGTTDLGHMKQDLSIDNFRLTEDEILRLESISSPDLE